MEDDPNSQFPRKGDERTGMTTLMLLLQLVVYIFVY